VIDRLEPQTSLRLSSSVQIWSLSQCSLVAEIQDGDGQTGEMKGFKTSVDKTINSFHGEHKEDQNKERDLFFTRLLLWSNDITSAASSPQIPAAQHIFHFRRRPSILFEFHHFKPKSKQTPSKCPNCVSAPYVAHRFFTTCAQDLVLIHSDKSIKQVPVNIEIQDAANLTD